MAEEQDASEPRRRQTTRDYDNTNTMSNPDSPTSMSQGFATATTVTSSNSQQQAQKQHYHEPPTPPLPDDDDDDGNDGLTTDDDSDTDDDIRVPTNVTNAAPNPLPHKPKKPGKLAAMAAKLGLDMPTVITMFKGSLPPTIGIAMCQSHSVANYFGTVGYLVAIISVVAIAILPRGKFLMSTVLNLLAICFGAAVSMLALFTAIKAREHTTPADAPVSPVPTYNSSQSAVCAVWLFFNIWLGNVVRAKIPAFNLPVLTYSIFINIAGTYGPLMATQAAVNSFIRRLLTAMLCAFAIALAVNLLVFPVSSRLVVFKEIAGAIGLLRKTSALQKAYLASLESDDMFAPATRTDTSASKEAKKAKKAKKANTKPRITKEAKAARALAGTAAALRELAGKLHADMGFAKRDIAWGRLDAKDLGHLFTLLRNVYIPVLGMTTIIDIFKRVSETEGWHTEEDTPPEVVAEKEMEKRVWNEVMKQMHEPFDILSEAIDKGLQHAALQLDLTPRPKKSKTADIEEKAGQPLQPGDLGYAQVIHDKVTAFYAKKGELLKIWVKQKGLVYDEEGFTANDQAPLERQKRDQAQLNILLYMENLMHASGIAVYEFAVWADSKVQDGTMSRKRLIMPGFRRLEKWILAVLRNEDSTAEPDMAESSNTIVSFGDGFNKRKKDPEHLPPATAWQRFGNRLRKISKFFGSEESAFGFRVACATMSVGIVAYLKETQHFFREQRLVWAMIMVAIGMTMTSGQSLFGFICRTCGTVVAMVLSLIVWYIVDGHVPGVIVFLWLSVFLSYYFFLKYPRFVPGVMVMIVTQVMIVGYELQVKTIGRAAAERTGQPVYNIYLLGPYRLACVAGGCLVAFIWTIFPSPLTDRTCLRRDLSATLYLVANYASIINSTLQTKLCEQAGDVNIKGTPAHQLFKFRSKIFGKLMMLIPSMSQHSEWQKWEPTIGGRFPREVYEEIILRSNRIAAYLTLMSYTITHPIHAPAKIKPYALQNQIASPRASSAAVCPKWDDQVAELVMTLEPTHHTILSTLTLLSNSLLSGQSLPPFVPLPRPYEITRRLIRLGAASPLRSHPASTYDSGVDSESESESDDDGDDDDGDDDNDVEPFKLMDARSGEDDYEHVKHEIMSHHSHLQAHHQDVRHSLSNVQEPASTSADSPAHTPAQSPSAGPAHLAFSFPAGLQAHSPTHSRNPSFSRPRAFSPSLHRAHSRAHSRAPSRAHSRAHSRARSVQQTNQNLLEGLLQDEPGYAEFAVLQVCTGLVCDDLEGLVKAVISLVGVVDFSFRVGTSQEDVVSLGRRASLARKVKKIGSIGRGKGKAKAQ
ncbi:hypothetical protein QBC32DRAFT_145674 [Pseudoneurospora amorphoporcata]|uniref:ER transporter 6TM N-terminal domain-containing protein n=1 Tax=Pseudoneurospora amorphoporcata TaxID=241081 RepID=A0AAN6NW93_9PEZI|nr:hypothetical protein QBC32DRAFT_145674 [Pseudoneurospora amorphoporcata]